MAVLSGKDGTLYVGAEEITPVANWRLAISGTLREYTANDTGGWKRRVAGAKDCRGSFTVNLTEAGHRPVDGGDAVTLKLHVDGTGNNYYEVEALIGRVGVETNIRDGAVVAYRIDFAGNGGVTPHGVLAAE
ncbi:MAG: hypothetical protein JXB62_19990 [Pirellulales bacterium]|nr:hypothetical protein [Pirellulales bacterium]